MSSNFFHNNDKNITTIYSSKLSVSQESIFVTSNADNSLSIFINNDAVKKKSKYIAIIKFINVSLSCQDNLIFIMKVNLSS